MQYIIYNYLPYHTNKPNLSYKNQSYTPDPWPSRQKGIIRTTALYRGSIIISLIYNLTNILNQTTQRQNKNVPEYLTCELGVKQLY